MVRHRPKMTDHSRRRLAEVSSKNGGAGGPARLPEGSADAAAYARGVLRVEASAIEQLCDRIDGAFSEAVTRIFGCDGRVVVSGMGKAGFIAQKISATFASTGTPSLFLHPAEALHGDLGRVVPGDLVLALSNSGETEEILRLLPALKRLSTPIIALTGGHLSPLPHAADVVLEIGPVPEARSLAPRPRVVLLLLPVPEACPLGLAATASTAALLALGAPLPMTVLRRRG